MRQDLVPGTAKDAPYFYLSYAQSRWEGGGSGGPDPDYWVNQLFVDLSDQVDALRGASPGAAPGFMGRQQPGGRGWPDGVARALATCRVFVPLYSQRYFQMSHCGREWSAFALRLRGRDAAAQPAVIPAAWVPVEAESLPKAARLAVCDDGGVQSYADFGIYGIMKLSRYRADYQKVVLNLAGRIVDAAADSPDDGSVLDYGTVDSAFGKDYPGDVAKRREARDRAAARGGVPRRPAEPRGRADGYGAGSRTGAGACPGGRFAG